MGTISAVLGSNPRLRTYAEAGVLGAVAAICVLAILVVAAGMVFSGCPAGSNGLADCFGGTPVQTAAVADDSVAGTDAPVAAASAAVVDQPTLPVADAAAGDEATPAVVDAATTPATTEVATTAETPADPTISERLATTLPAIADSLPMAAAPVHASTPATAVASASARSAASAAAAAARSEAAATAGADSSRGTELAYADTAVATEVDTTPPGKVRVGSSPVNVHAAASAASDRVGALNADALVTAKAQKQGWVQVADANGREGWVDADYLSGGDISGLPEGNDAPVTTVASADPAPAATPANPDAAKPEPAAAAQAASTLRYVSGQGVNVRSGPSVSSGKLFALKGGAEVTLTGQDDHGWLQVTDANGRKGWLYKDYVHSR